jgi:hypothetical protein
MRKIKDSKEKIITTKIPKNVFGPRKNPPTNSTNCYARNILRGESSEVVIENTI